MTREDIKKAREHCKIRGRCKTCPLMDVDECDDVIRLETEHEEEFKTKLKAMANDILAEIEAALDSNYAARKERIEKGHTSDDFLSVIEGKIAALRGMQGFVEELLDTMLTELEKEDIEG